MKVSIIPLKQKAMGFPANVRDLILSEPDNIDASEFIIKIGVWEKLVKISRVIN